MARIWLTRRIMKTNETPWRYVALIAVLAGCGGTGAVESSLLKGVDEAAVGQSKQGVTACLGYKSTVQTTADLNLRTGPSTSDSIIVTMPSGSIAITWDNPSCPTSGWYRVYYGGLTGWASGTYLNQVSSSSEARDEAIARAEGAMGFSYWWGHGAFKPGAAGGSCSGSCPSCTHSGSYGGDCSGLAAKVWVVPSTNNAFATDSHPYSTVNFDADTSLWSTVSRGSLLKADALVYNVSGAGHIFMYESGDGWGSMWAYECKGCVDGCVHDLRTASTSYHGIRHY